MEDIGAARDVLEKAWKEIKGPGISYTRWRDKTRLLIALAEVYEKTGDRQRALYLIGKAPKMATDNEARKHQVRALHVKARILCQTGRQRHAAILHRP